MPNTSATGGYLVPVGAAPFYDEAFEDFMHDVLVGLTAIDPTLVRPRWQPEPANLPDVGSNWVAFGITNYDAATFAHTRHNPSGDGSDEQSVWEGVRLSISSYGPNASGNLAQIRDGLQVNQNRAVMDAAGVKFIEATDFISAPSLVKDRWLRRYDMNLILQRQVNRVYPILNVLTAQGVIHTEKFDTPFIVTP